MSPSPASPARASLRLRLYGRAYCHLCEDMARELRALGVEFDEIDIDRVPELAGRFDERVPVLTDAQDGEICHYRLDTDALARVVRPRS